MSLVGLGAVLCFAFNVAQTEVFLGHMNNLSWSTQSGYSMYFPPETRHFHKLCKTMKM